MIAVGLNTSNNLVSVPQYERTVLLNTGSINIGKKIYIKLKILFNIYIYTFPIFFIEIDIYIITPLII